MKSSWVSLILCFDSNNSFTAFDRKALVKLHKFNPDGFDDSDLIVLENYIRDAIY